MNDFTLNFNTTCSKKVLRMGYIENDETVIRIHRIEGKRPNAVLVATVLNKCLFIRHNCVYDGGTGLISIIRLPIYSE